MTNEAFNRELKNDYSWLPIGLTSKIINKWTLGRWTLIASVFSNGMFLCMIAKDTVKSSEFIQFLWILRYVLRFTKNKISKNIWITLDNAPVHTANKVLKYYNSLDAQVYFLPPHSPNLAPVELFFRLIKKKMMKVYSDITINFDKQEGRLKLFEILKELKQKSIHFIWREFVKNSKRSIIESKSKL